MNQESSLQNSREKGDGIKKSGSSKDKLARKNSKREKQEIQDNWSQNIESRGDSQFPFVVYEEDKLPKKASLQSRSTSSRASIGKASSDEVDFGVKASGEKPKLKKKSIQFSEYELAPTIQSRNDNPNNLTRASKTSVAATMHRSSTSSVKHHRSSIASTHSRSRASYLESQANNDYDSDSSDGSLVGEGSDVDDDAGSVQLPLFVPETYEVVLMNAERRSYDLDIFQRIFVLLTDSSSCLLASIYGNVMIVIILLGVLCIIISSMNIYMYTPATCQSPACNNDPILCPGYMMCPPVAKNAFNGIDEFIVIFFTIDFLLRLFLIGSMPIRINSLTESDWDIREADEAVKKNRPIRIEPTMTKFQIYFNFICSFEGAIDIVSVVPFYVLLATNASGGSTSFVRVCRIFRIFKVVKSYGGIITVFKKTFIQSFDALLIMALIILVVQILFACIIFAVESGVYTVNADNPQGAYLRKIYGTNDWVSTPFDSIPTSMYWAIITLTTVGYGDLYPVTAVGRALASIAAVGGILCIALPVTVIGSNFSKEFEEFQIANKAFYELKRKLAVEGIRGKIAGLKSLQIFIDTDIDEHGNPKEIEFEEGQFNLLGELILTKTQREDLGLAFRVFDSDGSGAVSYKEMGIAVSALGFVITKKSLRKLMVAADTDKSGELSLEEFQDIFLEILRSKYKVTLPGETNVNALKDNESFQANLAGNGSVGNSLYSQADTLVQSLLTGNEVISSEGQHDGNSLSEKHSHPSFHGIASQNPLFLRHHLSGDDLVIPKLTIHSCSHAELVDYTNKLLAINAHLAAAFGPMTHLIKQAPAH